MSERVISDRPIPVADELTRPFWDAAARHELRVQGCSDCQRLRHPPTLRCPRCGGSAPSEWRLIAGPLRLRSWTTVHVDVLPSSPPPFVVGEAGINGEDAVAIVAQITPGQHVRLRVGTDVTVGFIDLQSPAGEPFTLLTFAPVVSR